jgi:WD40 repeat protein
MSRVALLLVLLTAPSAAASDLPPGAVARLGDDRFRAGGAVDGLAFSPDGKHLLSWLRPECGLVTVALWEVQSGKRLREATLNSDLFCGAAWGPTGALVVVRRTVVDTKTGRPSLLPDDFRVWNIADFTSPAPPLLERIRPGERVPEWRADVAQPGGVSEFREFSVSANGRQIAVIARSTLTKKFTVEVFALQPAGAVAQLKHITSLALGDIWPNGIVLTPGNRVLLTDRACDRSSDARDMQLQVWDLSTAKAGPEKYLASFTRELGQSWDGQSLAVRSCAKKDTIAIIDLSTGKHRAEIPWPRDRRDSSRTDVLAFSPDDKQLLVAVQKGAVLFDIATRKERGRIEGHAGELTGVAFSPDGKLIATADSTGLIRTWEAETLHALSKPIGHRSAVTAAELSPDGKRVLTWAWPDETVFIWDLATGAPLRGFATFLDPNTPPPAPAFTPDGLSVVLNMKDHLIARDIQTGLERPLPDEMAKLPPGGAVFAPNGAAVLTYPLARDELTVWDWPGGKKRFTLCAPKGEKPPRDCFVRFPGFSTDGKVVFSAAPDPDRWDAVTGQPAPAAWKERGYSWTVMALRSSPELVFYEDAPDEFILREAGSGGIVPGARCRNPRDLLLRFSGNWPAVSPDGRIIADRAGDGRVRIFEPMTTGVRRELLASGGFAGVLGFTPDGVYLLTAGGDHTVLVWDVRLRTVPLPEALKRETDAVKLWEMLSTGKPDVAYLAMSRLARDPGAAVKMARLRLAPAVAPSAELLARTIEDLGDPDFTTREKATKALERWGELVVAPVKTQMGKLSSPEARARCAAFVKAFTGGGAEAVRVTDARAIELLEALDTDEARALLKELAGGHADAFRTQEAKRVLERNKR